MTTDEAEDRVAKLLAGEPAYRSALYKILVLCQTPRTASEVEEAVRAFPEMKVPFQSPQTLLSWLAGAGAIAQVSLPQGRGREEEKGWQTTEAGRKAAEREDPGRRLAELLGEQARYREVYLAVLRFCEAPRTRVEVERLLDGNPLLEEPKVYASYFLQNLEARGGVEWVDNRWRTTEAGKGLLS